MAENLNRVTEMMVEIHNSLIVTDDVNADDVSAVANSTAKTTKLDMLLAKIRPLMGVSWKWLKIPKMSKNVEKHRK